MINPNVYIIAELKQLTLVYRSIVAFFYQKIDQSQYINTTLSTYKVDYSLLLPSSNIIQLLNASQCNAQIQEYINECQALVLYINTNVATATNITIEGVNNALNLTISNLNGYTLSMLKAQSNNFFTYETEYDMSFSEMLFKTGISLSNYDKMVSLNQITDLNDLKKGQIITLSK